MNDATLQRSNSPEDVCEELASELARRREDALARGASPATDWIFFRSPPRTWELECGREGWILFDPESERQHDYVETMIS